MRITVAQYCLVIFSRAFVQFCVAQHWLILRNAAQRCATLSVIAQYGSVLFGAARRFLLYLSNAQHGPVLLTSAQCCSLPLSVVQYCSKLLSIAQQFPALFNSYENRWMLFSTAQYCAILPSAAEHTPILSILLSILQFRSNYSAEFVVTHQCLALLRIAQDWSIVHSIAHCRRAHAKSRSYGFVFLARQFRLSSWMQNKQNARLCFSKTNLEPRSAPTKNDLSEN